MAAECEEGSPFLVTHVDAYRSAADKELLARKLSNIEDGLLRDRVTDAFAGKVCVRDQTVLVEILKLLKADEEAVRAEALNVLTLFASEVVVAPAREALRDSSARVRLTALAAIVSTCDSAAIEQIDDLRRHDPSKDVRRYAKEVQKILEAKAGKCVPLPRATPDTKEANHGST